MKLFNLFNIKKENIVDTKKHNETIETEANLDAKEAEINLDVKETETNNKTIDIKDQIKYEKAKKAMDSKTKKILQLVFWLV